MSAEGYMRAARTSLAGAVNNCALPLDSEQRVNRLIAAIIQEQQRQAKRYEVARQSRDKALIKMSLVAARTRDFCDRHRGDVVLQYLPDPFEIYITMQEKLKCPD